MNWYLSVIQQFTNFSGRARRMEYWMFFLFNIFFVILATILDNVLGLTFGKLPYGIFYFLYAIFSLIPGLAVCVRRLHDVGKSGWMIFISLIPIIGGIWLLILLFSDSQVQENEYGESPKYKSIETVNTDNQLIHNYSKSDTIVFIVIIWLVFSRLFWAIFSIFIVNYYSTLWFKVINIVMTLIWSIIPICLSFVIKNKSKHMVVFILGILYLLYSLYEVTIQLIKQIP